MIYGSVAFQPRCEKSYRNVAVRCLPCFSGAPSGALQDKTLHLHSEPEDTGSAGPPGKACRREAKVGTEKQDILILIGIAPVCDWDRWMSIVWVDFRLCAISAHCNLSELDPTSHLALKTWQNWDHPL